MHLPEPIEGLDAVTRKARRWMLALVGMGVGVGILIWRLI